MKAILKVISGWYESISSEEYTKTSEIASKLDIENEYWGNRDRATTRTRKQWKLYWNNYL